jgi:tRNA(fMet)-specific endonuclease VapC
LAQLMVDTSVFVGLERSGQQPTALAQAYPDDSFAMAAITASELLHGVYRADSEQRRQRREAFVEGVLQVINVVSFDLNAARQYARTLAQLFRIGQPIRDNDLLIAATALAYGFTVLTGNLRDFSRVPGLAVQVFEESVSRNKP